MGETFYGCIGLEKLELPEVEEIGSDAFALNMRLETVIGLENIETVEENSDPFRYTLLAEKTEITPFQPFNECNTLVIS